jgi:2-methylisocitrate lyase-like PEP mutase family enzyme
LYAPGLKTKEEIATLVRSVDRPINVVMGLQGVQLNVAELSAIGVKRISVGSALSRAALGAFLRAAQEMKIEETFNFAKEAIDYKEIMGIFGNWKGQKS